MLIDGTSPSRSGSDMTIAHWARKMTRKEEVSRSEPRFQTVVARSANAVWKCGNDYLTIVYLNIDYTYRCNICILDCELSVCVVFWCQTDDFSMRMTIGIINELLKWKITHTLSGLRTKRIKHITNNMICANSFGFGCQYWLSALQKTKICTNLHFQPPTCRVK
jgi:hypothetical protein